MSLEEFKEWDEAFLEQAIRIEEESIFQSASRNPTQHHQQQRHHNNVASTSYANTNGFSPPRELTQRWFHGNDDLSTKPFGNHQVQMIEDDSEVDRLKAELDRVSEKVNNLKQECLELRKDRDQKQELLKLFLAVDEKDDRARYSKNGDGHQIGCMGREHEAVMQDHLKVPTWSKNASTSNHPAVAEYPCEIKDNQRTLGSRGTTSQRLPDSDIIDIEQIEEPSSDHQSRDFQMPVNIGIQNDGLSETTDLRPRVLINNASTTSNGCTNKNVVLPETPAQQKFSKLQTDTSDDCSHLMTKDDMHSHELLNDLLAIWGSPYSQRSGRRLVSKLLTTCAADFYSLFRCMGMSMPPNITLDSPIGGSFSDVFMHEKMKHFQFAEPEAAKVANLYFILAKMNNEMVQLDVLIDALLDLCCIENVVVVYRALHILHVVLQHMLSLDNRCGKRDNVVVEGIPPNSVDLLNFEKVHFGGQFGLARNQSSLPGDVSSSLRSFQLDVGCDKEDRGTASFAMVSAIDWVSLFGKIHHIATGNKDEGVLVEAISVMHLILMRSNPCLEREKFGSIFTFQTVAKLLQKDVGLHVRKQVLRLLFLLLNWATFHGVRFHATEIPLEFQTSQLNLSPCILLGPKLSVIFCSGVNDVMSDGAAADNIKDVSMFQVFSKILDGLAECVKCRGHSTQELKLRHLAIVVLAFIASSGKSGFEVILNPRISDRFNFLELIMQVLASEMDAIAAEPVKLTEICKERFSLIREALILLNRLASNPAYSSAVLQSLTSSRDIATLTIDVINRMSKISEDRWRVDSNKRRKLADEIVDLTRVFRLRVYAYLEH